MNTKKTTEKTTEKPIMKDEKEAMNGHAAAVKHSLDDKIVESLGTIKLMNDLDEALNVMSPTVVLRLLGRMVGHKAIKIKNDERIAKRKKIAKKLKRLCKIVDKAADGVEEVEVEIGKLSKKK